MDPSAILKQGYNTYFNNSVLTHVLMPQGFAISLGFKFYNTKVVLKEALIGRFGEKEEQIHPGPRSYDGRYTELTLTCSGHEVLVQSAAVGGKQYLLVTPLQNVKRPPTLLISAALLWNMPGTTERDGDTLLARLPGKEVRVYTDGAHERQLNAGMTSPYLSVALSAPVAVSTDERVDAAALAALMAAQKALVLAETARFGTLSEAYNAMRTCLAWDTIYEPEKEQVCSPVSRIWNLGWGGYVLFDWDTYFSAMMAMVDNKPLAYANALAITREKTEDGFIPNFGSADDDKSRDRSQPPVGSLAVREIYRLYREKEWIEAVFDDLLGWNRWFAGNRCLPNGQLCWGSNHYEGKNGSQWEVNNIHNHQGAAFESGLDNSPMYDDVPFDAETNLMALADVGLTGLYIMDCEALASLADEIGRPEAAELRARAALSKDGLEDMWDESIGMYCNKRTDTGALSHRLSPTNFYALFSDRVSPARVKRIVDEHFYNPDEFFGAYMMPSIARNDPAYPEQDYWRGRIWSPMNYLAYLAMRRHDCAEACHVFAEKSKELLLREWTLHGHVHENYDAETGMGCGVINSDKFYHWGALLALIAMTDAGYLEGPEKAL